MATPLFLACKSCGRQFFSGVDDPPPEPRTHECSWCHDTPSYELNDYVAGHVEL